MIAMMVVGRHLQIARQLLRQTQVLRAPSVAVAMDAMIAMLVVEDGMEGKCKTTGMTRARLLMR